MYSSHHAHDISWSGARSFSKPGASDGARLERQRFCRFCPRQPHPAKRASASSSSLTLRFGYALLALDRLDACDGAAHFADTRCVVELRGRLLEPQVELLAFQLNEFVLELIERKIPDVLDIHGSPLIPSPQRLRQAAPRRVCGSA